MLGKTRKLNFKNPEKALEYFKLGSVNTVFLFCQNHNNRMEKDGYAFMERKDSWER